MAIVTTPLGFQKPDGGELVRNMDELIATNAQLSQDFIDTARNDLAFLRANGGPAGGSGLVEDPANPGFYLFDPTTFGLTEDTTNPGLYFVNGA